jgi:hypothetical protein
MVKVNVGPMLFLVHYRLRKTLRLTLLVTFISFYFTKYKIKVDPKAKGSEGTANTGAVSIECQAPECGLSRLSHM